MKSAASTPKGAHGRTVRLDIASRIEMIEVVQTVLAHLSTTMAFDEDAAHYMSVAVRESVVNAMKHGNAGDETRRVLISFTMQPGALEVSVQDEGPGFDPAAVADPVAQENLLKPDGRGIFFMRSFMDEVRYSFPSKGGTVVTMVKKAGTPAAS
jgi:serine/threonine-protein kinase RsbW